MNEQIINAVDARALVAKAKEKRINDLKDGVMESIRRACEEEATSICYDAGDFSSADWAIVEPWLKGLGYSITESEITEGEDAEPVMYLDISWEEK